MARLVSLMRDGEKAHPFLGRPGAPGESDAPARPSSPAPGRHGCHASVRGSFLTFTEPLEGRIHCMYLDIRGLVTTAVGNLIDTEADACRLPWTKEDGSTATEAEVRAEWRLVKGTTDLARQGAGAAAGVTKLRLTDDAIDALVRGRFDANTRILRRTYAEWDSWPADGQLGCHSMLWVGSFFPLDRYWPKFNAAARAREWASAAETSRIQDPYHRGLTKRNPANHRLFLNAAKVDAEGLDATALLFRGEAA